MDLFFIVKKYIIIYLIILNQLLNINLYFMKKSNFISNQIYKDIKKLNIKILTRFPPEPNGFLHIGHIKSIWINFGIAKKFNGQCNLRFDDTNPSIEKDIYVKAIQEDIKWLGFKWNGQVKYASDYFEQIYDWSKYLIHNGKAYVDDLSYKEIHEYRGTLTKPGINSPYRNRSVKENIDLIERMRQGEFLEGNKVLRAKIDMSSPNINLRDPIIYRIRNIKHHKLGYKWKIYPSYDFAHGQSDAIEGITHSICTLEFEDHRPLYNWFLNNLPVPSKPRQIEFARLNIQYTITSKRKIKLLIDLKIVNSWDDPRLSTISGLRRRGYTPESLHKLCEMTGITRSNAIINIKMQYHAIRSNLEEKAPRAMCIIKPIKLIITNIDKKYEEILQIPIHPKKYMGIRNIPFNKELWIDIDDFMLDPPNKFYRLTLGNKVRLRNAYVITCNKVVFDKNGRVYNLLANVDFNTLGVNPKGYKIKGVIHWVSIKHGVFLEIRKYNNLFKIEDPEKEKNFLDYINYNSIEIIKAIGEPYLKNALPENCYQFERVGYFCADRYDHNKEKLVFNKTVNLKDSWNNYANI
ncbi:Glutaminyl-tRNA synthetase [Candidatus Johnevansia muelleri]|uniref:Glutamine--tRNA ligase n=1 Tax=Candidatus Johnevansia muelleri TaxID=1495769 RepID=A0A078KEW7_9GAMM|nr:Glutaminyl-tRNA synthetase [Candidatus Evansia muelleri]